GCRFPPTKIPRSCSFCRTSAILGRKRRRTPPIICFYASLPRLLFLFAGSSSHQIVRERSERDLLCGPLPLEPAQLRSNRFLGHNRRCWHRSRGSVIRSFV